MSEQHRKNIAYITAFWWAVVVAIISVGVFYGHKQNLMASNTTHQYNVVIHEGKDAGSHSHDKPLVTTSEQDVVKAGGND